MKTFLDFIPILLFFAAYKLHYLFGIPKDEAIYFATPVLMAGTVAQMAILYWIDRKLSKLHLVTLALILILGGVTLAVHDKRFIMWKPTVLYAGMAIALALPVWGTKRLFLKSMLGGHLELPDPMWSRLNLAWIFYSIFMAAMNAVMVLYFSEDAWANSKIWSFVFPLAFLFGNGLYIYPHVKMVESVDEKPPAP